MENTARIDISEVSEIERFKAEIEEWSMEDMKEWLHNIKEKKQIVEKRIKSMTVPKQKMYTRTFDTYKRKQKADVIFERKIMEDMIDYFLRTNRLVMAGIAVMGFNTALRFGDIQKLRVCDVVDRHGNIKDFIVLEEEKNKNIRTIYFNESCRMILDIIAGNKGYNEYLFASLTTHNAPKVRVVDALGLDTFVVVPKFISEHSMCDAMQAYSDDRGIKEHYRTHSFRSSCINLIARESSDIFRDRAYGNEVACAFVGHKSVRTTEEYYLRLSEQERRIVHDRLEVGLDTITAWLCDRDKEKNRR